MRNAHRHWTSPPLCGAIELEPGENMTYRPYPRQFKGAAEFYLPFRSDYPSQLVEWVVERCGLSSRSRVLDLGSGPGLLAKLFAPFVAEVVAVDPEPGMLAVAQKNLGQYRSKVRLVQAAAHELQDNLGRFDIVTIGRAFHWMNREQTLVRLEELTNPGATVALFRDPSLKLPQNRWRTAFDDTFAAFATSEAARDGAQSAGSAIDEEHLLLSAFRRLERMSLVHHRTLTIDHLVGRAYSMAGTSPEDLGDRRGDFESALRSALLPFSQDGYLLEVTEPQALLGRRSAEDSIDSA